MKIDEDSVVQGDQVWHDRYGWGNVVKVGTGTCDVKFNYSTQIMTFTDGGKQNGFKVLWWSPPVIFTPRKGVDYSRFLVIVEGVRQFLYGE